MNIALKPFVGLELTLENIRDAPNCMETGANLASLTFLR